MLDKILSIVTLGVLTFFCGVLVWMMPEEADLTVVVVVVVGMAAYDFYQSTFRRKDDR